MRLFNWLKKRWVERGAISTGAAAQIRLGIATGELVYNLFVKNDTEGVGRAMYKAGKTPKLTYEATLRTLTKKLQERS